MAKVTLSAINDLDNETNALAAINANKDAIVDAIENTLSRDGTSPNSMSGNIDMNSNRILNLPAATISTEPVRKAELDAAILGAGNYVIVPTDINIANVTDYGATGNGVTVDTNAFTAAKTALGASGGIIFTPPGTYKVANIILDVCIRLVGSGRLSSILTAGGVDTTVLTLNARGATVEHMAILGMDSLSATQPTVVVDTGGTESLIDDCYITFGDTVLSIPGADNVVRNSYIAYAYGTTVISSTGGGTWFDRVKVDQDWPTGTVPTVANQAALSSGVPARANTTAYTANQIVTSGGYLLQCKTPGTSGGSSPTIQKYFTDITDGSVVWQLVSKSTYYGMFLSGASSQHAADFMDFTGCYTDAIHISGTIFSLKVSKSSFGQFLSSAVATDAAGHSILFSDNEVIGGILPATGSCLNIGSTWAGPVLINNNTLRGDFWGTSKWGVVMGGSVGSTITGNWISSFDTGVALANVSYVLVSDNTILSSATLAGNISGTADYYRFTDNVVGGSSVSDTGSGSHKSVTGNT